VTRIATIIAFIAATSISHTALAEHEFGADHQTAQMALKGVRQVTVQMNGFSYDFDRIGLSEATVRGAVEQKLRGAGIEILDQKAADALPTSATFLVDLHANQNDYGIYSYATDIQLLQKIPLATGSQSFINEKVWSRGASGWARYMEMRRLNQEIDLLVDQFLADYAAQNGAAPK
jgi:hypothetical protein